jgi:hypothetical protein
MNSQLTINDLLFVIIYIFLFAAIVCGMSFIKFHYFYRINNVLNTFKGFIKSKLYKSTKN